MLYIPNYCNHSVFSYDPRTSSIRVMAGGNSNGTNSNQLILPTAVFFDSFSKSMIIANFGAHNIVRWGLGANSWSILAGDPAGVGGSTSSRLNSPTTAIMDPMGNLYVVEVANHRVQLFPSGQLNGTTIAGVTSRAGNNASLLNFPRSLALDSQLNLYVGDCGNHRVQKFLRY